MSEADQEVDVTSWWLKHIDEIPRVEPDEPDDPEWLPLQHHFGLTMAGLNVFRGTRENQELIAEHDESGSGQEELYLVLSGRIRFWVDREAREAAAGAVLVVRDPMVERRAVALEAGAMLLAVGGLPDPSFRSTWEARHFVDVPRAD